MSAPIRVSIIGAPVACKEGVRESWREIADWANRQLQARFGEEVRVRYFDLFDPDCPPLPPEGQLPVVYVEDELISCGGKISVPQIRKKVEELQKASLNIR